MVAQKHPLFHLTGHPDNARFFELLEGFTKPAELLLPVLYALDEINAPDDTFVRTYTSQLMYGHNYDLTQAALTTLTPTPEPARSAFLDSLKARDYSPVPAPSNPLAIQQHVLDSCEMAIHAGVPRPNTEFFFYQTANELRIRLPNQLPTFHYTLVTQSASPYGPNQTPHELCLILRFQDHLTSLAQHILARVMDEEVSHNHPTRFRKQISNDNGIGIERLLIRDVHPDHIHEDVTSHLYLAVYDFGLPPSSMMKDNRWPRHTDLPPHPG